MSFRNRLYWKVRETHRKLSRGPGRRAAAGQAAPDGYPSPIHLYRPGGEKFIDSWRILFYYLPISLRKGGDPSESAALFHAFKILKHRRPGSLGKALDSEAGYGRAERWGHLRHDHRRVIPPLQ